METLEITKTEKKTEMVQIQFPAYLKVPEGSGFMFIKVVSSEEPPSRKYRFKKIAIDGENDPYLISDLAGGVDRLSDFISNSIAITVDEYNAAVLSAVNVLQSWL